MNRYDVKAKFHEILQTKMLHMKLTPENVQENLYNTITLHYSMFKDDLTPEIVEAIYNDPDMPPPHREYSDIIDQGMAVIEVIMSEELFSLSCYISRKLAVLLNYDYNGLKLPYAMLDYKNISQMMINEGNDVQKDLGISNYAEVVLAFITADIIDVFCIDGIPVSIMESKGLEQKFARFNLAGLDFIMIKGSPNDSQGNVVNLFGN